jgi:hypothetical protein
MMTDPVPIISNEAGSDKHIKNTMSIVDIIENIVDNIKRADEQAHYSQKPGEHRLLVTGHRCELNIVIKKNKT